MTSPKRLAELQRMQRHEDWISRPARDLFPRLANGGRRIKCRGCSTVFETTGSNDMTRTWCSPACRAEHYKEVRKSRPRRPLYYGENKPDPVIPPPRERKVEPSQPCPPGPGGGLGDATPEG